jgi:N-acetylneuraminate synthase
MSNLIIAEIAQAHDGSLGTAHAYIDAVARAGVNAVKFQTHIASAESTPGEPWRVKFSYQDSTRFDYWKRMEFTEAQWAGLQRHATERGLLFLSSPFSIEAAELLIRCGISMWKVASGEITNEPLVQRLLETGFPMILSSGMSSFVELDRAVAWVKEAGNKLTVLQCTSLYPTPPAALGLNMLGEFRRRYGCAVGLSDHSGTIYPAIAATALGSEVIEVHVTFSRDSFGPDVPSSVTVSELADLVRGVRVIEEAMSSRVDKDLQSERLETVRRTFSRSVVAAQDLKAGDAISASHVCLKKPGSGIPSSELKNVIGRRLVRDVAEGTLVVPDDFCPLSHEKL